MLFTKNTTIIFFFLKIKKPCSLIKLLQVLICSATDGTEMYKLTAYVRHGE